MTDSPYSDTVLEHFEFPRNVAPDSAECGVGPGVLKGHGGSVSSGVWMAFSLEMRGQVIHKAQFRAYGCPHSIALASWLTEQLVGETLVCGYTLSQQDIASALDLPTEKMRSVLVAEDALQACANQLNSKEAC